MNLHCVLIMQALVAYPRLFISQWAPTVSGKLFSTSVSASHSVPLEGEAK